MPLALQREGRLGTYPSILGQEAAQVGSALALSPADWVFPSFREMGVHLTLGYPIQQIFQYWAGDERGQRAPDHLNIFPFCVSVGTHIPHAVGAAMAARFRRDPVVAVAYFGDGATSKGDFHEGFNMAGVFRLPVVFICQNNQWAISVPLKAQTAAASLAQKAVAYGFDGVQVDGNDVFAVYRATAEALDKARNGEGQASSSASPTGWPIIPRLMMPLATDPRMKWRRGATGTRSCAWNGTWHGRGSGTRSTGRMRRAARPRPSMRRCRAWKPSSPLPRRRCSNMHAQRSAPRQAGQLEER